MARTRSCVMLFTTAKKNENIHRRNSNSNNMASTIYKVLLDENWDYCMQKGREKPYRVCVGTFDTYEAALETAKAIVNGNLSDAIDQGKTADEALLNWSIHGREPFISPAPPTGFEPFSARNYARQRSADIVDGLAKVMPKQEMPQVQQLWKGPSRHSRHSRHSRDSTHDVHLDHDDDDEDEDDDDDGFAHDFDGEEFALARQAPPDAILQLPQLRQDNYGGSSTTTTIQNGVIAILVVALVAVLLAHHGDTMAHWLGIKHQATTHTNTIDRLLAPVAQNLRDSTCHLFLFCEK